MESATSPLCDWWLTAKTRRISTATTFGTSFSTTQSLLSNVRFQDDESYVFAEWRLGCDNSELRDTCPQVAESLACDL